jgi:hypothetical protein
MTTHDGGRDDGADGAVRAARLEDAQHAGVGLDLFNAVLIFGFAHAAWFYLARVLPPIASS